MNQAISFIATLILIGLVLVLSELAWRKKLIHGEIARKGVHIITGVVVAFSPLFIGVDLLRLLALLMLIGVIVSRRLNLFRAVHDQRSYGSGEVFFALGILITTLITQTDWIIIVTLLHMSLADGLAAVIGMKYGRGLLQYKIFGQTKSIIGTLTFYGVSTSIILWAAALMPDSSFASSNFVVLACVPAIATACENLSPNGSDNTVISLTVASILTFTL